MVKMNLRERILQIDREEQERSIAAAAIRYIIAHGPCDNIVEIDDFYCDIADCTYCNLARSLVDYEQKGEI
jgi:hypothetical protein